MKRFPAFRSANIQRCEYQFIDDSNNGGASSFDLRNGHLEKEMQDFQRRII